MKHFKRALPLCLFAIITWSSAAILPPQEKQETLPPLDCFACAVAEHDPNNPNRLKVTKSQVVYPKNMVPPQKMETVEYTVRVPFTEVVTQKDGTQNEVTRFRVEKRTRKVPVTLPLDPKLARKQGVIFSYDLERLSFHSAVDLSPIKTHEIAELFRIARPILFLQPEQKLDTFLMRVLKKDIVIVQRKNAG